MYASDIRWPLATSCFSVKGAPRSSLTASVTLKTHFHPPSHLLAKSSCWNSREAGKHFAFSPWYQARQWGRGRLFLPFLEPCKATESSPQARTQRRELSLQPAQPTLRWWCQKTRATEGCGLESPGLLIQREGDLETALGTLGLLSFLLSLPQEAALSQN